jgi:hypothetical protein
MYNSDLPTRAELPTTGQLLRSTVIAIAVAVALLVTVVLPSEYAIDPTGIGRMLGLTQMGEIKMSLAIEAEQDRAADSARVAAVETAVTDPAPSAEPASRARAKADETSVTLKPGEGTEVKVEMAKGARVRYEWTAAGGPVNHNTHADGPGGASHLYAKATGVERDSGELVAPFDGHHGWYWRNRTEGEVTVTLKTSGEYKAVKRMK